MRAKHQAIRVLVLQAKAAGKSFEAVAAEFEVPLGTVKTWWNRYRHAADMKPAMKPHAEKENEADMKPGMKPHAAMFRGVTRYDLPGKSVMEQSMNFRNLKKGTYPPKCWHIPGFLQGAALIEAIRKANEGKGTRKVGVLPRNEGAREPSEARQTNAVSPEGERSESMTDSRILDRIDGITKFQD